MKLCILLLIVATFVQGSVLPEASVYGYLKNSVAIAEQRRLQEEKYLSQRIVGGTAAQLGQIPFQAGLLSHIQGLSGNGVCGASLINNQRLITAAHCWADGVNQAFRFTVILGSTLLFSGGTRIDTEHVVMHSTWIPALVRNDVAVIYLPSAVGFSNTIAPVALPSGSEIQENFAGSTATASGFGLTSDGGSISSNQFLSRVDLPVITNFVCRLQYPVILQDSNICTSGDNGRSTCRGDSGGPLVVTRNNRPILIGVTSFGSTAGCQAGRAAAFARVTSFLSFFNQHL